MITFSNIYGVNCSGADGFRKLANDTFCLTNSVYEAQVNKIIFLDTRNGEFSVNFPETAEAGDTIIFVDVGGNLRAENVNLYGIVRLFGTVINPLIPPPGSNLPTPVDYILNKNWSVTKFVFVTPTYGWTVELNYLNNPLADNPITRIPEFVWNYSPSINSTIISTATDLYDADILLNNEIVRIGNLLNTEILRIDTLLNSTVKQVNNLLPDTSGNVNVGTVKSINNIQPDTNGNITLTNSPTASKIQTPVSITLTGAVSGTVMFDGSQNVVINTVSNISDPI
ncbi:MAG: hypothetical protein IPH62_19555 [Ignavibacteriae bacterium]|nr:hypothetical protein [Ignavibacteriota bacterium]